MSIHDLIIIGDRINPGFKSTGEMLDREDIEGIQALAVRQVESGAHYLDLTVGPRGYSDHHFLVEVIRAVQDVVDVPLCFDYPDAAVQEVCLKNYDPAKAQGQWPMVNSLAETRQEMFELFRIQPFKPILMASEYLQDGIAKSSKETGNVVDVARRLSTRLVGQYDLNMDDIFVDITICSLASDTEGLTKMALEAIRRIGTDPEMKGIHIMGGITNIGNMLPPKEFEGMKLRLAMENAFLTVAVPLGFDAVMCTPWNDYRILPEDSEVLQTFRDVIELRGMDSMRRLRMLWAKKESGIA